MANQGYFGRLVSLFQPKQEKEPKIAAEKLTAVAATEEVSDSFQTFDNGNLSSRGEVSSFDYESILRDKQGHITDLYSLADYYSDADEIIHGIVHHIYVPYSSCSPWQVLNVNEKTRAMYEAMYSRISLKEKIDSVMLQYWKYGNVVLYYMDGNLITLPIHKCKIGNMSMNGDPLVDYNCQSILNEWRSKSYVIRKGWIDDGDQREAFKSYPEEIVKALNNGDQYAQLNPENTFVMQGNKEDWMRYAVPFIAACLKPLAKKALISRYEDAMLNIGSRPFVHVRYGNEHSDDDMLVNGDQLNEVQRVFSKAMNGFPLVATNAHAKAEAVQIDTGKLFEWKKYEDANTAILSAGGVSGILVTGVSNDGSTFASAQVSMQTAATRIEAARREFCKLMTRVNLRILQDIQKIKTNNLKDIPVFTFKPLDMSGQKALREACEKLWERGVVSTRTLLEANGYSMEQERAQLERERDDGSNRLFVDRKTKQTYAPQNGQNQKQNTGAGRPEMTDDERTSDPSAAERGKQPKPSNPDGSIEE